MTYDQTLMPGANYAPSTPRDDGPRIVAGAQHDDDDDDADNWEMASKPIIEHYASFLVAQAP